MELKSMGFAIVCALAGSASFAAFAQTQVKTVSIKMDGAVSDNDGWINSVDYQTDPIVKYVVKFSGKSPGASACSAKGAKEISSSGLTLRSFLGDGDARTLYITFGPDPKDVKGGAMSSSAMDFTLTCNVPQS